jgi:hypothetical protein
VVWATTRRISALPLSSASVAASAVLSTLASPTAAVNAVTTNV